MNELPAPTEGVFKSRWLRILSIALVLAAALGLFAVRATAPHNFLDKDQERPASYVLDILQNGNWICQTDWMNDITSKPPMLTWIGALLALLFGGAYPVVLYIPSALALTLLAVLIHRYGNRFFGMPSGLFAALFFLLSPLSMRLFILLRTDAVFAFFVGTAALAAYHAWTSGKGWTLFWMLAAMATLTKGPLGVLLALGGLLAYFWERTSGTTPAIRGRQWPGILLFVLLTAGWFALAYLQFGDALIDKIIRRELVAHAVDIGETDPLAVRFFKPLVYFIHRMLPWSLLGLLGLWRVVRHPCTEERARRFERFLTCWFLMGLMVFSLSQHQRGDLLAPILAPAMLLAGREAARLLGRLNPRRQLALATGLVVLSLLQSTWYYHRIEAQNKRVQQTQSIRAFAARIKTQLGDGFPFSHTDEPYTFQLYLGTMRRNIPIEEAVDKLAGADAAWVVASVDSAARMEALLKTQNRKPLEVARCHDGDAPLFVILGNQPLPANLPAR